MEVSQLCPTLFDPMEHTVHGVLQVRILEWVAVPFSSGSSQPRDGTQVFCIVGRFFTNWATREVPKKLARKKNINQCVGPMRVIWRNYFIFIFYFFIGGYLLYNVVLISAIQQCQSIITMYISPPCWAYLPPHGIFLKGINFLLQFLLWNGEKKNNVVKRL